MKTTVRMTVILPEATARVQRLYDDGAHFKLVEEVLTDPDEIVKLIHGMKLKDIDKYISDDDLKEHTVALYEYNT